MTHVRRNPFRDIETLFDRYNRFYVQNTAVQQAAHAAVHQKAQRPDWVPAVDIIEKAAEFRLKVELPEVKKEDVKVSVDKGVLTVSGERKLETEEGEVQHRRSERSYGTFSRSFTLPEDADEAGINAAYKDGVLVLTIPRAAKPEPRAIDVQVH
jgi:HSP20 family protein